MYLMKTSLFAYGFRSNFFLAGLAAAVLVPLWVVSFVAGTSLGAGWPPTLWHAHEMLFGFIASAIAGFMLTAVPSWTGQKGFAGVPLMALATIWLSARLLIASSSLWPPWLPAIVDLAYLPFLAALVMIPLLRSKNRNTPLLIVLAALWLTNLVFHVALIRHDAPMARHSLIVGIDIVIFLVTVIGGRIVPAFTAAALRQQGVEGTLKSRTALTVMSVVAMAGVVASDIVWPDTRIAGWVAAVAAAVQLVRLSQWRTRHTLRQPIVWILHLAYAWLPLGLALKAGALLGGAWHCGILAARAHDRRTGDHDYRGHDAGSAWPHWTTACRPPIDHRRVCAAHGSRSDAGVWIVAIRIELSRGDPMGGTLLDDGVRVIPRRLCPNFMGTSRGRQS